MTTATKPRKKTPAAGKATSKPEAAAIAVTKEQREWIEHLHEDGSKPIAIELDQLVPSRTNPRKTFDEAKLAELAQSILLDGILQPIVCRPMESAYAKERYEIVCGERRYRAAKKLNLASAPCSVRELSDQDVIRIQQIENLQREDLNAIEEAEGFRKSCMPVAEGGGGYSQTELAKVLGVTQGHISNRMRLLALPGMWRERVISQEIPPTHARSLVPWAEYPTVVAAIEKQIKSGLKTNPQPSTSEFEDWVDQGVLDATMSIRRNEYCPSANCYIDVKLDKRDIAAHPELQLVEVKEWGGNAQRAINVELARQLLATKFSAATKKAKGKRSESAQPSPGKPKLSEKEVSERLFREIAEWRANWLRWLIARRLAEKPKKTDGAEIKYLPLRLMLWLLVESGYHHAELQAVAKQHGVKWTASSSAGSSRLAIWNVVSQFSAHKLDQVCVDMVNQLLCDITDPANPAVVPDVDDEVVEAIAKELRIDEAAAWREEKAGPFTEGLLTLLSNDMLSDLAEDWRLAHLAESCERDELIDKLVAATNPKPLPAVLAARKPKKK